MSLSPPSYSTSLQILNNHRAFINSKPKCTVPLCINDAVSYCNFCSSHKRSFVSVETREMMESKKQTEVMKKMILKEMESQQRQHEIALMEIKQLQELALARATLHEAYIAAQHEKERLLREISSPFVPSSSQQSEMED